MCLGYVLTHMLFSTARFFGFPFSVLILLTWQQEGRSASVVPKALTLPERKLAQRAVIPETKAD